MSEPKECYNEEMLQIMIDANNRSIQSQQIEDENVRIITKKKKRGLFYKLIGGLLFIGVSGIGVFYLNLNNNNQQNENHGVIMKEQVNEITKEIIDPQLNNARHLKSEKVSEITEKLDELFSEYGKFTIKTDKTRDGWKYTVDKKDEIKHSGYETEIIWSSDREAEIGEEEIGKKVVSFMKDGMSYTQTSVHDKTWLETDLEVDYSSDITDFILNIFGSFTLTIKAENWSTYEESFEVKVTSAGKEDFTETITQTDVDDLFWWLNEYELIAKSKKIVVKT